jgi:sugar fermentation stimulation protein A
VIEDDLMIFPVAIGWSSDLDIGQGVKSFENPGRYLRQGIEDTGSYLLVLKLERERLIKIGRLGEVMFREGYYIYVGSAMRNLRARIERHRRKGKKLHWHIDYLTWVADGFDSIPIRSSQRQECEIAQAMSSLMKIGPSGFGSSDCRCLTHLFWSERNPVQMGAFHRLLQTISIAC